jgi:hypothetical protein
MAMALAAALGPAPSAWAGNPKQDSDLQQVSYATSQSGASLEWRSFRPAKVHQDRRVVKARAEADSSDEPSESRPRLAAATGTGNDPFHDPFGDGKPRMLPAVQAGQASAKALGEVSVPNDGAPQFPSDSPAIIRRGAGNVTGAALQPLPEPKADGSREPTGRSLEDELAAVRQDLRGKCPSADKVTPIADIKLWTRPKDGNVPPECGLGDKEYTDRCFSPVTYTWKASALCHKPLVFEEPQLERYGHSFRPIVQPICSAAHFFICVPAIPYILGVEPPNECVYTLGYYRPGSCAPYTIDPLPLSVRGALFEGAAIAGGVALLP